MSSMSRLARRYAARGVRKAHQPSPDIYATWNVWLPQEECEYHFGKHYIRVIVWHSKEAMWRWVAASDGTTNFNAMHAPEPWAWNKKTKHRRFNTHISTLHFVKNEWSMEIVAHEIAHFIFFLGSVEKALSQIEENNERSMANYEEPYCYLQGWLTGTIYKQLWERNGYGKHFDKTSDETTQNDEKLCNKNSQ